MYYVIPIADTK